MVLVCNHAKLPLDSSPIKNTQAMRATGTDGKPSNLVAPTVALPADFRGHPLTFEGRDDSTFHRPDTLGDNGLRAYIPAPHTNPAWWCNGSTSDSESLPPALQSGDTLGVTAVTPAGCTTGCTKSPENERGEAVGQSFPIKADSFSAALAMIASLPLSDAEKAQAVRRIMAEQVTAQGR